MLAEMVYFDGLHAKHVVDYYERVRLRRKAAEARKLMERRRG